MGHTSQVDNIACMLSPIASMKDVTEGSPKERSRCLKIGVTFGLLVKEKKPLIVEPVGMWSRSQ